MALSTGRLEEKPAELLVDEKHLSSNPYMPCVRPWI
jgi:hypothetical protein